MMECSPSFHVGNELPYRINGTMICGLNPYRVTRASLEKCCAGPITNITSPAPTSGPFSDSWPLTCFAYCAVKTHLQYDESDSAATDKFVKCVKDSGGVDLGDYSFVCTGVNGFAPNECIPFRETPGCTQDHSTWGSTGYLPTSTAPPTTTSLAMQHGSGNGDPSTTAQPESATTPKDSKKSTAQAVTVSKIMTTAFVGLCMLGMF